MTDKTDPRASMVHVEVTPAPQAARPAEQHWLQLAEQHKGRADDCGALARAVLAARPDAPQALTDERAAFEADMSKRGIDTERVSDGWTNPYKHSHVESLWAGWQARAALSQAAPAQPAQPEDGDLLDLASLGGIVPLTVSAGDLDGEAQPAQPDDLTPGLQAAAAMLDKKANDYADEHGSYDPDTGATEFRNFAQGEYYDDLRELADEIRAIAPVVAQAQPADATVTIAQRIAELIVQHGSLRAASRSLECDPGYLSRLQSGEKDNPDNALLDKMGLRREVSYKRTAAAPVAPPAQQPDAYCVTTPDGGCYSTDPRCMHQPAQQPAHGWQIAQAPDKCPITRRPFFMVLEHPELGRVPTYGGPYDSYTIPEMDGEPDQPWHERELTCHRYDHDEGEWRMDSVESVPLRIINDDLLNDLLDKADAIGAAAPAQQPDERDEAEAARELRKALGISQDFSDWPRAKLMRKAAQQLRAAIARIDALTGGRNG